MTDKEKLEAKKNEYWNHLMNNDWLSNPGAKMIPRSFTPRRLRDVKAKIWNDSSFWDDVILRHSGHKYTPEQLFASSKSQYEHCFGNMVGMIRQSMQEMGFKI